MKLQSFNWRESKKEPVCYYLHKKTRGSSTRSAFQTGGNTKSFRLSEWTFKSFWNKFVNLWSLVQLKYFATWNKVAGYNRDAVLSKVIIAFFSLFLFVWYFYSSSKIDGFFITDKWNLNYPLLIIKMTLLPRNLSESRTATTSLHNLQNSYRILIKLNNYLN